MRHMQKGHESMGPEGSTLQSITVTADHGVSITKAYRTPIKIPGMMGS
jgi:hypothetical protein